MYRMWLALAAATISSAALAQITFDERDSVYDFAGVSTAYTDVTYTYTATLLLHSALTSGEDYIWDWSQKLDATPTPPAVTSDVTFDYAGLTTAGKHRYVFHLPDKVQHTIQIVTHGAVGSSFTRSWITRDENPGDGHSAELLFQGGGFLTSPASVYVVKATFMDFVVGEGSGELQAQVLSENATHTLDRVSNRPVFTWRKTNVSQISVDLRLHGSLVPEPSTAGVCVAGVAALAGLRRRRR
jgi:hypothetical protein